MLASFAAAGAGHSSSVVTKHAGGTAGLRRQGCADSRGPLRGGGEGDRRGYPHPGGNRVALLIVKRAVGISFMCRKTTQWKKESSRVVNIHEFR